MDYNNEGEATVGRYLVEECFHRGQTSGRGPDTHDGRL